jgi:hypothetical protein
MCRDRWFQVLQPVTDNHYHPPKRLGGRSVLPMSAEQTRTAWMLPEPDCHGSSTQPSSPIEERKGLGEERKESRGLLRSTFPMLPAVGLRDHTTSDRSKAHGTVKTPPQLDAVSLHEDERAYIEHVRASASSCPPENVRPAHVTAASLKNHMILAHPDQFREQTVNEAARKARHGLVKTDLQQLSRDSASLILHRLSMRVEAQSEKADLKSQELEHLRSQVTVHGEREREREYACLFVL